MLERNISNDESAWYLYHSNQVEKIITHKDTLNFLTPEQEPKWCGTAKELFDRGSFHSQEYINNFFSAVADPYIGDKWIEDASENDELYLPCPFTGEKSICKESFYQGINYLRFVGKNNEVFWIFQSITSFDIAYFPLRNVFLVGKHPPHTDIEKYSKNFSKNLESYIKIWEMSKKPKFLGLIISHFFPFHFYSEAVPALERASQKGLLEKVNAIYARKGGCFFELSHIWPEIKNEYHFDGSQMDTIPNANGGFSLMLGNALDYSDERQKTIMRNAYSKIATVSSARFSVDPIHRQFSEFLDKCTPIIWFGVQATKRSWIEQITGTSEIIKNTLKKYPTAGFIFDGWTSPLYERKADIEPIDADKSILYEILKLTGDINFFSLIGYKSPTKIAVAQSINAFITNYGTGSLHVARIARKHGVGHINTTFPKGMHVHYNTICLSDGFVKDIQIEPGTRADAISYSLDWRHIDLKLQQILDDQLKKY
jgi:hypothetical protein